MADGPQPRVQLLVRAGCHLCDAAREIVARTAEQSGQTWREIDIDGAPDLARRYFEYVPVVLVDGRPHDYWRVDEARLRATLGRPAGAGRTKITRFVRRFTRT